MAQHLFRVRLYPLASQRATRVPPRLAGPAGSRSPLLPRSARLRSAACQWAKPGTRRGALKPGRATALESGRQQPVPVLTHVSETPAKAALAGHRAPGPARPGTALTQPAGAGNSAALRPTKLRSSRPPPTSKQQKRGRSPRHQPPGPPSPYLSSTPPPRPLQPPQAQTRAAPTPRGEKVEPRGGAATRVHTEEPPRARRLRVLVPRPGGRLPRARHFPGGGAAAGAVPRSEVRVSGPGGASCPFLPLWGPRELAAGPARGSNWGVSLY